MSDKTCIEFLGGWSRARCGKPAGFGLGGNYCKTHALSHPSGDEPVLGSLWVVGSRWVPTEVPYIKRTAKTITTVRGTTKRTDTRSEAFFDTREECVAHIREMLDSRIEQAESTLARLVNDRREFGDREDTP